MIKKIIVKSTDGTQQEVEVGQLSSSIAQHFGWSEKGESNGNIEIKAPKNLNLRPAKSIKIKPGNLSGKPGQIELLPDYSGDLDELVVKVWRAVDSEGNELTNEIPVRLVINASEAEFNSKNSPDGAVFDLKFKSGADSESNKYSQAKIKARSIDLRCYSHGGVAIQPAGVDEHGNENKIKFESDRTSLPTETAEYCGEGGKGIEFGTFNTEKTSIFTPEYRFNKDGIVYAVERELAWYDDNGAVLEQTEENRNLINKIDYKTQADDFKDIKSSNVESYATWTQIVKVASDYALGKISAGSGTEGEGGVSTSILENYLDKTTYNSDKLNFALATNVYAKSDVYTKAESDDKYVALSVANFTTDSGKLTLSNDKKVTIESVSKGVEIKSGNGEDIKLTSGDNLEVCASKVKFTKEDTTGTLQEGIVQAAEGLSLDDTPYVKMLETKISSGGELSVTNPVIKLAMQNNMSKAVYFDKVGKKVHIPTPLTVIYSRTGEEEAYEYPEIDPATIKDINFKNTDYPIYVLSETDHVAAAMGTTYSVYSTSESKIYDITTKSSSNLIKNGGVVEHVDAEGIITEPENYTSDTFTKLEPGEVVVTKTIDLSYVASLEDKLSAIIARLDAIEASNANNTIDPGADTNTGSNIIDSEINTGETVDPSAE